MYMKVYSRCPHCGIEGLKVRQLLRECPEAEIIKTNTKELQQLQKELMIKAGLVGYAEGLIVDGDSIRSLREWKPSI